MPNPGEHHPAFEEYCECIFELREDDVDVIQARIAERLRVSRPSVSEMIRRMADEGLVAIEGNRISLTQRGEGLAMQVVRRHRLAERFLTDIRLMESSSWWFLEFTVQIYLISISYIIAVLPLFPQ